MNEKDKKMMDILVKDKGDKYKVVVDDDNIYVLDVEKDESIYNFEKYGCELILQLFQYLNINAEMC